MPDSSPWVHTTDGVLVLDKPPGPTSHDMVARLRRKLPGRRIGHLGTLDPFATGVLPLCVGRATRLAQYLGLGEKTYQAAVRFGFGTDTGDWTGRPLSAPVEVRLDPGLLEAHLAAFRGEILQKTPSYSARKVQGVPLYRYARQGTIVETEARKVRIHELTLLEVEVCACHLRVCCSPGTYIRALAADLGDALGCGAHLTALRRTAAGEFCLDQAVSSAELEPGAETARLVERLIPLERLMPGFPKAVIGEESIRRIANGSAIRVSVSEIDPAPTATGRSTALECIRLFSPQGRLVALARAGSIPDRVSAAGAECPTPDILEIHPFTVLL
jgi:tRNA pseudouridine55 synthase